AGRRDERSGPEGDPGPQPRRGEGALRHGPRVVPAARCQDGRAPQGVPFHHRLAHRAGAGEPGRRGGRRRGSGWRWALPRHRQSKGGAELVNTPKRDLAPLSTAGWKEIDAEATRVLKLKLAGGKLVDFEGPLGPAAAGVNTGRREPLSKPPLADIE